MPVEISISAAPIEPLRCELLEQKAVLVNVLRLDKIHPLLNGNKWFKLKYNLEQFQRQHQLPILSFGGAYSNHLHALAAAGKLIGMKTIGVLRGELVQPLNPVLQFASEQGMTLLPISRADYRRKLDADFVADLRRKLGDFHLLPEGGSNASALKGCGETVLSIKWQTQTSKRLLALSCGTGTTMAGLLAGLADQSPEHPPEVLGVSVLKAQGYMARQVREQLRDRAAESVPSWRIDDAHHCGGYARENQALRAFLTDFASFSDIPIEPVYTGKLFYALFELIASGKIAPGTEVLAIHSGGVHC